MENSFSIKEVSKLLDCSTQNIYQQKSKLMQLGYMIQDTDGNYCINEYGVNYLREIRTKSIKETNKQLTSLDNKSVKDIATPTVSAENEYISILKERIEELKKDNEYWKNEYIKKDNELKDKNEYIQGINTKMFALLDTEEGNKKQAEKEKRGFLSRLFN